MKEISHKTLSSKTKRFTLIQKTLRKQERKANRIITFDSENS